MLEREMGAQTEENCTVPWVPNNEKICDGPKDVNTSFWIAWNRVTNQKKAIQFNYMLLKMQNIAFSLNKKVRSTITSRIAKFLVELCK